MLSNRIVRDCELLEIDLMIHPYDESLVEKSKAQKNPAH